MAQPPSHIVQTLGILVTSPRSGEGRHDQFWDHLAESPANCHGNGESNVPPTAPAANCKKALRPNFITSTLSMKASYYDPAS
jgi:hypothetical protein